MRTRMTAEQKNARREARRNAREAVFTLLFETEYHEGETPEAIYDRAVAARELNTEDTYLHDVYFGVMAHIDELDERIGRNAKGWKTNRLSRVSRAVLRLCTYELVYMAKTVPAPVAINEAVELTKKFDDEKARPFVNGVLNAIKDELAGNGSSAEASAQTAGDAATEDVPAENIPTEAVSGTAAETAHEQDHE